jgi:hypothetical protein
MIARSKIGAKIEKKGPLSISIEKVLKKLVLAHEKAAQTERV